MNMKKALAAVLAVVIAISAMAVSVFAVDAVVYAENEIPLLVADPITNYTKVTYKFEVPVYAQFGYLTDSNYLKVTLPANLSYDWAAGWEATPAINWSVEVNGTAYDLKDFDYKSAKYTVKEKDENGNEIDVEKPGVLKNDYSKTVVNYINFGYLAHSYFKSSVDGSDVWATVPQSQMVGDTTAIYLVATINLPDDNTQEWALFKNASDLYKKVKVAVQMFDSLGGTKDYDDPNTDDVMVTGSYVETPAMTKNWEFTNAYDNTKNLFLSYLMSETDYTNLQDAHVLTWDHNLANRAKVMGTTTAKVVVETLSPITGFGFYNLYAVYQDPIYHGYDTADYEGSWWDISTLEPELTRVGSSITVTAPTSKLEFEIDPEILYETNYGVFNYGFVVGYVGVPSYNNPDFSGLNIYNSVYWPYLGSNVGWGSPVDATNYAPSMLKAYILVDAVEEEVVTPDEPVEGGDVEVDEGTDVEVEENPETGLVLAVLPMIIAAAAVVISKR